MRKQHFVIYKWIFVACILLIICFQLNLPKTYAKERTGFIIVCKNVSIDEVIVNNSVTKVTPDYHNVPKQIDEKLIVDGANIKADDNHLAAKRPFYIDGIFLSKNRRNNVLATGEKWLTVFPAKGRLGNQMFQIASIVGIADKLNYRAFIPINTFEIDSVFERLKPETIKMDVSKSYKYQEASKNTLAECDVTRYSDMSFLKRRADWTLDGYLQSFKHFWHVQDALGKLFSFKSDIIRKARQFIDENAPRDTIKVGIHVRRGDFLSNYHRNLGRITPGEDYYKRAMDMYSLNFENVTFYVFSNDIAWCQGHLQRYGHKVVFSPFTQPGYDLAAMSLCDHMIISVGTFGWWGGWLAGGSVVYYSGYPKSGSEISKYFVKEDIYPPFWQGIT